jgi:cell division septum initiation protein DivIVA
MAAFDRVVDENQRLQRENVQLAGQVGFLQSELRQAREQINLLTDSQHTPEPPAPEAETTPQAADQPAKRVPWWRKWFADI